MRRAGTPVIAWFSGAACALGACAILQGLLMIDVPPGVAVFLAGIALVAVSIILALWAARRLGNS